MQSLFGSSMPNARIAVLFGTQYQKPPCVWSRQAPTPSQEGEPRSPTTARTRQRKAPRPQSQRRRYRPPHRSCSGALAPLRPGLPSGGKWTPSIPLNYRTICENRYPLTAAPPTNPTGWRLGHRACRSQLVRMVNICPHCEQPSQNRCDVKGQSVQRTSETYSRKRRGAPPAPACSPGRAGRAR